jgi:CheY-like chemotaxis protein
MDETMKLETASRHAISLVLSDVTMPGMDGFALAKQVHEMIRKPFTLSDFAKQLRAVLDTQKV